MSKQYRPRLNSHENQLITDLRNQRNVGVIGDTHEPFCIKGYREFCEETFNKFGCTEIVHIGDEVDNHALSFHEHDPDGHSAGRELDLSLERMADWYKSFHNVKVCIGNHTALHFRQAKAHGIPKRYLRGYNEVLGAPKGWEWGHEFEIDGVQYKHGMGVSGKNGALNMAIQSRRSSVIGHLHTFGGIQYHATKYDMVFGLNVGCGIDVSKYAFEYGRNFVNKPTIGCGVVLDGGRIGLFIPMPL